MERYDDLIHSEVSFGKFFSFIQFLSFIFILPAFLKYLWPYFLAISDLKFYVFSFLLCNLIIIVPYNLMMWYIYKAKIPFFEKYRNSIKPWPWEENLQKWKHKFKNTIVFISLNLFVLNTFLLMMEYFLFGITYKKSIEEWPQPFSIFWQFIVFMIIDDSLFYWIHRLLHHPKFYWIHKRHHEYNITISLAVTYVHPLEYILTGALPTGLGYHFVNRVVSVHFVTIFLWISFRLIETYEAHSGYRWSWAQMSFLPWKQGSDYHGFHHSNNDGNYCSLFPFWDIIMKTNQSFLKHLKSKQSQ